MKPELSAILFFLLMVGFPVNSQIPVNGLVAHYKLDGSAQDASGYGNNGFIYGTTGAADRFNNPNNAFYFNGISDYIFVPNKPILNPTDAITVTAWYKTTPFSGSGVDPIVNKAFTSHVTPYYQYHLGVCGNQYWNAQSRFSFYISINDKLDGVNTENNLYDLNTWYHLAGTYDGTTIKLYVNGVLQVSKVQPGKMKDYGSDIYIGRHKNENTGMIYHLPGTIDDVRIYNRALTQAEITSLYSYKPIDLYFTFTSQGECVNTPVKFNYSGFSDYDSLKWNFGDNTFSRENSPSHNYKTPGDFDVTLSMYYKNQKIDQNKKISIAAIPSVNLGNDTTLCEGNVINLDGGALNATFLWNTGLTSKNIMVNKPGTYQVHATNLCGSSFDDINIFYSRISGIRIPADTLTCRNSILKINSNGPDGYDYIWQNSFTGKTYEYLPKINETIDLVVTDQHKCAKSFQTKIILKDCFENIKIPNVFTPNGDGMNDFWVIENLEKYTNALVEVFNRWGEPVFKSTGYEYPWDGYYHGKRVTPGTYYYNIILNTGQKSYSGPLMIY